MALHDGRQFEIVHDERVGRYLYVFEKKSCVRDYLQDSESMAKQCAADGYGVPIEAWTKAI